MPRQFTESTIRELDRSGPGQSRGRAAGVSHGEGYKITLWAMRIFEVRRTWN